MNAERWEIVKSLFLEAATLPSEEQRAFLKDVSNADEEISALLDDLLSQSPEKGPNLYLPCWLSSLDTRIPNSLEPGRKLLERFEIIRFLGAGGIGEVYQAFDHQQKIYVALKTLRAALAWNQSAIAMLRNEVNTARSVTHRNVCRLYDFHWGTDAPPFVTMELLDGETLAQCIHRGGPLLTSTALPIVKQLLDALEAAHQKGIIHRDLKTANVMLTENGARVVVMDFGLAREVSPGSDLQTTLLTNGCAGTPAYMAPEQLRGQRATMASDVHALGVVLFEILTGHWPFEGASSLEVASRRLNGDAPSPRRYAPGLDRRWEYTILRCLNREPRQRPQSVAAVRELLTEPPPILWLGRRAFIVGGAITTTTLLGVGAVMFTIRRRIPAVVGVFDIENQTNEADLTYLCRGTTSELIRRLAKIQGVSVLPIHATRPQFHGQNGARFSFDGILQLDKGQVRLGVQILDAQTGRVVWAERFDRKRFDNLIETQDAIAKGASSQLQHYLAVADRGPFMAGLAGAFAYDSSNSPASSPTASSAAFDYFMRGNSLLQEGSQESIHAAIDYFHRAVREDSKFALAFASLAEAQLALRNFGYTSDVELARSARDYAEKAVQQEPTLAEAHAALGAIQQLEWNWEGSETSYNEALRLKPKFPRARRWRAGLILQFARFSEALSDMQTAFEEDPYDRAAISGYGLTLLFAGKCREAVNFLERGIGDRDMPAARYNLCQAYARLGSLSTGSSSEEHYRKALDQAEKVASIERRSPALASELSSYMFSLVYSLRKEVTEAEVYLQKLREALAAGRTSPIFLAMAYAAQENRDMALELVDKAVSLHDHFVLYLRVNIFLEKLWGQRRFEAVLHDLRLK